MIRKLFTFVAFMGLIDIWPNSDAPGLSDSYTLVLSSNLPDFVRAATYNAAGSWNMSVAVDIELVDEAMEGERPINCREHCYYLQMAPPSAFEDSKIGYTFPNPNCDCGIILIAEDFEPHTWAKSLVGHEIGHMLGLQHLNGATIMNRYISYTAESVTCADAAEFYKVRHRVAPKCDLDLTYLKGI